MWADKWLLPPGKGQDKINTFIIIYPKQKQSARKISDKYKKKIKGSDLDHHWNHHDNKWEKKLKD